MFSHDKDDIFNKSQGCNDFFHQKMKLSVKKFRFKRPVFNFVRSVTMVW